MKIEACEPVTTRTVLRGVDAPLRASKDQLVLHAHCVVAGVDIQRRPGHVSRRVGEQERGRGAHVVGGDVAMERRALLDDCLHRREARDRPRGQRPHRAGRDRVHADVLPAEAQLLPIKRTFGELTLPRLRAGTIHVPRGHASGRLRVIVTLKLPPLAAAYTRAPAAFGGTRRLDVASASSRAYLARVAAAQRVTAARLHRAIPGASIGRRFRIVLDGLTVTLPVRRLPQLVRLGFVRRVYPSLRFTLTLDRSPSLIGADVLHAATGARGQGVKIGVVDDGIDQTNPFFDPAGYSYPAGFPKGDTTFTTPKVIVAKSFPGPGAGTRGALPLDRQESFHGTHVAGIAAGDEGTNAPAGRDHPPVPGLSGVAPRAWIGNYRVFTVPTPIGNVANTPEIVAAFEAAVADGMNVINFSGGGPESDPADAPLNKADNTTAAATS